MTDSVLCILVYDFTLALSDSNHENDDLVIQNLIDQSVAGASEFQLVAIGQLTKPIGFNARILEYFSKFLLELLTQRVAQFVPLFQCATIKFKTIGHPDLP